MNNAFAYVRNKGYICSSDSYPYVGYVSGCIQNSSHVEKHNSSIYFHS